MDKYTFYGRLKKEFPSQVIVDATENCNYRCVHCPHANFAKSEIYTGANLSLELHNKMVDEVGKCGKGITQQIRYTANGEPLLHKHIYEMLSYASKNSGVMVSITTNGSLLDENNIIKILNTGISLIDISLDANSPEVYSKVRINGNFEQVKNNVLNLISIKNKGNYNTRVVVSFVKQPLNEHETTDFEQFWYKEGVDYVVIRNMHTAAGANDVKMSAQNAENRKPCVYPWERILLSAKGHLDYCPNSWLGKTNICNYESTTIKDTWSSQFYENLRSSHLTNNFDNCSGCRNCEDWQVINWPEEGRGYGDMIKDFQEQDNKKEDR